MGLKSPTKLHRYLGRGLSQLTLVEHALCPLDARVSLREQLKHECHYRYVDPVSGPATAHVKVTSAEGLSANDEFYLWGLLGLTFAQREPTFEFHATPHYCLRELGLIEGTSKGGESYRLFRESLRRLSSVRYQNDRFYDPIRREHRSVSFGFLSYSLPVEPRSSRAWRIVWDPLFFEICTAAGSRLGFDLEQYHALDPASRRLFLLLKKVFWRRASSPWFDVRDLAVNVLGFSPDLLPKHRNEKIRRVTENLQSKGIVADNENGIGARFVTRANGAPSVKFYKGPAFHEKSRVAPSKRLRPSPDVDVLQTIGFDEAAIVRIMKRYSSARIQLWADVTLAALETKGTGFFKKSPQAFFMNNIRAATDSCRTPPDWWLDLRKEEDRREATSDRRRRDSVEKDSPANRSGKLQKVIHPTEAVEQLVTTMLQRTKMPKA